MSLFQTPVLSNKVPLKNKTRTKKRQKNKAGGIIMPDFKICHRTIVTKTAWYWNKRKEIPEIISYI
jgi:hypothetical protein